jgi:hypothetical protein
MYSGQHASAITTATALPLNQANAALALDLERRARSLLAERMHDGLVQNVAAALLLLASVQPDSASAERFELGVSILRSAFSAGRQDVLGSMEPLDRPLSFSLTLLLEGTGAGGSVTAPDRRLPNALELAVYYAVQDAVFRSCGPRPVRARVSVRGASILTVIRADVTDLELLVAALDFRIGLLGGSARPLTRDRGVALRLPLDHSE